MMQERFFTPGLAQVAYAVADEATGEAAIIDPRRDVGEYVEWASRQGLRITAVLETHVHADFVSGALELAEATGATIHAGRLGSLDFLHVPLDDQDRIAIGQLTVVARHTPGHTPEHISYLLLDPATGQPQSLYTGDLLFVGEVGRPDLLGKAETEQLASQLYHTFAERLTDLPDDVIVYPGHTAGSSCGKKIGDAPSTTLGQERRFNYALQARDKASFVATVLKDMPIPPPYYPTMKQVNRVGAAPLATLASPVALSLDTFDDTRSDGGLIIDVRDKDRFAEGHIPGSMFAGHGPDLVVWAGWVAPYGKPILLVADDAGMARDATLELRRIGIDTVAGWLEGGFGTWQATGRPVSTVFMTNPDDLRRRISRPGAPTVLDVRNPSEWESGTIANAILLPATDIARGNLPALPRDREIVITCETGYRSMVAASLLAQHGWTNLGSLDGGMEQWDAAGLPKVAA